MNDKIIFSDLKRSALNNLKGHWGLSIGVFLLGTIITGIFDGFQEVVSSLFINSNNEVFKIILLILVFGIISSFIQTIITYGLSNFSLNLISNPNKADLEDLFKGFVSLSRVIPIWLVQGIFMGILLLPISISSDLNIEYSFISSGIFAIIEIFAGLIHLILSAYISQAYFICIENPSKTPFECIKESFRMMNGHILTYLLLNLSFIGWAFLSIFTLGIGLLWLIPYTNITLAEFHKKLEGIFYENTTNTFFINN